MSPAFQFKTSDGSLEVDYVAQVMESSPPEHEVVFYIDNGGIGLEERLQSGIDAMLNALDQNGFLPKQDYFWVQDRRDNHSESAWAKRLPNALRLLIGKAKPGKDSGSSGDDR